ncbi:ECF-type sigma factor [Tahibacter sp.]|uniref:ECF-type sigma factor n=1 Tax=Tahibacter sp. TaxID=2056211 RepID=UPI0028C44A95|nr:ECF-type sigma factor [Tahibacter sp.]
MDEPGEITTFRRLAAKRRDPNLRSDLDDELPLPQQVDELVALDDALTRLAALDERQARVVELEFFRRHGTR